MASNEVYTIPNKIPSEVCYAPSAPMQCVPPPSYSVSAPPMSYTAVAPAPGSIYPPTSGPIYPSASGPIYPPAPGSIYPTAPVLVAPVQMPYQGVVVTGNLAPPQTAHIRDYMVWSIINLFLGAFLLGIIAVFLSSQTRKRKQEGDVHGARTLSNITLVCNILITIIFFGMTAFSIIYFVIILSSSLDELYR